VEAHMLTLFRLQRYLATTRTQANTSVTTHHTSTCIAKI